MCDVIKAKDKNDDDRTTAMGLWTDAKQHANAASILLKGSGESQHNIDSPLCLLLGHGIELVLKSYLRSQGKNLKFLKAIGHNLEKALDEAEKQNLSQYIQLSHEDQYYIKIHNAYYVSKCFEYRVTGFQKCVNPQRLISLLEGLIRQIRVPVNESLPPLDK